MRIVGLDLSLTRTGYATGGFTDGVYCTGLIVPPNGMRGLDRLAWIRSEVLGLFTGAEVGRVLAAIEGYSFGAKGRAVFDLGELGGVVRLALYQAGIPFVDVPPSVLKKYATGRGNAPKGGVVAAAIRRLGYWGHDDNEADALWLRQLALDHYGLPGARKMPAEHRKALASVDWPRLETPVRTPA